MIRSSKVLMVASYSRFIIQLLGTIWCVSVGFAFGPGGRSEIYERVAPPITTPFSGGEGDFFNSPVKYDGTF